MIASVSISSYSFVMINLGINRIRYSYGSLLNSSEAPFDSSHDDGFIV